MVVLVPGYGGPLPYVERWRIRVAERTLAANGGGVLIVSGHRGEAERLRALASPDVSVLLEPRAASTNQNVDYSLPMMADADLIAIASDRAHRRRATARLVELDHTQAARIVEPDYTQPAGALMDLAGLVYETARRARYLIAGLVERNPITGR